MLACLACASESPPAEPESAAEPSGLVIDSAGAATLRDSAKATLATLVTNGTAAFDSVVVVQPPADSTGRAPAMAVCGRIAGLPGRGAPARFVYQSKWTVFVEEANNQTTFGALWARSCEGSRGTVVIRE
jgi:hypothetical protein